MASRMKTIFRDCRLTCRFGPVPAPERLPVKCWQPIQSGSERVFDFMAKYGIRGWSAEGGGRAAHDRISGGLRAGGLSRCFLTLRCKTLSYSYENHYVVKGPNRPAR
jgi:hypothetical protein